MPATIAAGATEHPPLLPFVISVGVTGHRKKSLAGKIGAEVEQRIRSALTQLLDGASAVRAQEAQFYNDEPLRPLFISALADGADQIAAAVALELGFELHVILPFDKASYRGDLADEESRVAFDHLLARASRVLELPGDHDQPLDGYVMVGRATVSHCDLLIAVWDGLAPRGPGGTGEVVEIAVVNGTPVVHVPIDPEQPSRLLWSAFDPAVVTHRVEKTTERPLDELHLALLLTALFAPPSDPEERRFIAEFASEQPKSIRWRVEYPLLLTIAGVKRFSPGRMRESVYAEEIREEWARYRQDCAQAHEIHAPFDCLETAYTWSDQLATRYAQTYRSGHVFNFVFGGLAVCMGLFANILNRALLELALVEAVITAAIIINTRVGVKNEWHRRWLDYRQLAERLRPMRSLKLLALAAPDPPGSLSNPVARRWVDWYSFGVWRALGIPSGSIDAQRAGELSRAVAEHEVAPQLAYHQRSADQVELLDQRLERVAGSMFVLALAVALAVLVGLAIAPDWMNEHDPWFTFLEAGLPALGTAVFGIRFQGDFGGSAIRSQVTANSLREIEAELDQGVGLQRASDLAEQAARIMYGDLDEWRLINQQQDLDLL